MKGDWEEFWSITAFSCALLAACSIAFYGIMKLAAKKAAKEPVFKETVVNGHIYLSKYYGSPVHAQHCPCLTNQ